MKRTLLIISLTSLLLLLLGSLSFGSCGRPDSSQKGGRCGRDTTKIDSVSAPISKDMRTTYNIFIENSGSMKGFFSGKSQSDLETIINDYYDRLTSEDKVAGDTITLNYINTKKVDSKKSIENYLSSAKDSCTASYTKIDNILEMAMENANGGSVNVVISDYCFESDKGNYRTAQSRITKLFTNKLSMNNNLSVAILKYEVGFDGNYFPGRIPCKRDLPVYFWIFGDANRVKKVLDLHVKETPESIFLLQASKDMPYELSAKKMRAVDGSEIVVKNLVKDRHGDEYKFNVKVDLSDVILSENELKKIANYSLTSSSSSEYNIASITNENDIYTFEISTKKPSPGSLGIKFNLFLPQWVKDSSHEGAGIPPQGKTTGIKYLIEGVYDAYHNNANSYFTISLNLK